MAKKKQEEIKIVKPDVIQSIEFANVMNESYIQYAWRVIKDRAIPDARDGLKPSQRRILVTMSDLGIFPGKKHLKCAKISGNTSGDYHPHGEAVIYPTLVGMAQTWSMRTPLVDPQGNFGSVDGDPPAAMRYTEARISLAGAALLDDLSPDVVDYKNNYDESRQEPIVLPAKLPNLLLNGGSGIAVGYATNIPPHNLRELVAVFEAYIKNPNITAKEIIKIMPGPDFPTGGRLLGQESVYEYYETGRGSLKMEGVYSIETGKNGNESIVITQFPEGGSPASFLEQMQDLINKDKIGGINDLADYSSNQIGTKVVVSIGRNGNTNLILNQILHHTCLQTTFAVNNTVLIGGEICDKVPIVKLIATFINHRKEVLTRKFKAELTRRLNRIEILDGLLSVISNLDKAIKVIQASKDQDDACKALVANGIVKTENQAKAVVAITLGRLTRLENNNLLEEKKANETKVEWLNKTLANEKEVFDVILEEQKELANKIGDDRRTKIESATGDIQSADLIDIEDVVVSISTDDYVKRVPLSEYQKQSRGGVGVIAGNLKEDQTIQSMFVGSTHDDLLCFTDKGRALRLKVFELPQATRVARGRPIINFVRLKDGEKICTYLPIKNLSEHETFLSFISAKGLIKRIATKEFAEVNKGGLQATKIKDDDRIVTVVISKGIDDFICVTHLGNANRFSELDVRISTRVSSGVAAIKLDKNDHVIGAIVVPMKFDDDGDTITTDTDLTMMTITANGFGKRTGVDEYLVSPTDGGKQHQQNRGGKGRVDINVDSKAGNSISAIPLKDGNDIIVITQKGQIVRVAAKNIRSLNRGSVGVKLIKLGDGDQVLTACAVAEQVEEIAETVEV